MEMGYIGYKFSLKYIFRMQNKNYISYKFINCTNLLKPINNLVIFRCKLQKYMKKI